MSFCKKVSFLCQAFHDSLRCSLPDNVWNPLGLTTFQLWSLICDDLEHSFWIFLIWTDFIYSKFEIDLLFNFLVKSLRLTLEKSN